MSAAGSSEISGASRWLAAFAPSGAARPAYRAAIAAAVTSARANASPPLRSVMRGLLVVAVTAGSLHHARRFARTVSETVFCQVPGVPASCQLLHGPQAEEACRSWR